MIDSKEQKYIIHFYWLKKRTTKEIHEKLKIVYQDDALSIQTIRKWIKRFDNGINNINDLKRKGRPKKNEFKKEIAQILEENPFLSTKKLSKLVGIHKNTIKRILIEELEMKKINFKWIPHLLSEKIKKKRVEVCRIILSSLENAKPRERSLIITGDETWLYFENPDHSFGKKKILKYRLELNTISDQKKFY